MGACGSSEASGGSGGGGAAGDMDTEQKKRSQAIDRKLEEDSKKLRRECKILLLGMSISDLLPGTRLTQIRFW